MSDLAIIEQRQPSVPRKSERKPKITPRMRRAIHLMVWDFKTDNQAAVETKMTITHLRLAMREPHVKAYYREQLQVLRERESSRNIHTLIAVRDQESNQMARVQAVKALEQLADEQSKPGGGMQNVPGLVVQINVNGAPVTHAQPITIDNADGSST